VAIYEIPDFRKRGGEPERVTVVTRDEIDRFLGARSMRERQEHLRWLRDRGKLVTNTGRLQQKIWRDKEAQDMAYVFQFQIEKVPKIRTRPGVMTWR
jgi:hypothetical protein